VPQTERTGSVYASLTVPDFAKAALAMSGVQIIRNNRRIFRTRARKWLAPWPVRGDDAPGISERRKAVAAEVRVVTNRCQTPCGRDRHGGHPETATAPNSHETRASCRSSCLPRTGSRSIGQSLPLLRLHSGEYLLTFEARTGNQIERSFVRFTVDGL
jgi:hypothetical protein